MAASVAQPGARNTAGGRLLPALRDHWPEYLIEGWALGMFMAAAGAVTTLVEAPGSALRAAIANPDLRRVLIGLCMGLTAVSLIYSPWGKRSGAHMNPAVTLTFWRLGKVAGPDALFYVAAQFIGGTIGVLAIAALFGAAFTEPPVSYVATLPGAPGIAAAFVAEIAISMGLMTTVLVVSNTPRIAPWTGVFAGALVATYIGIEAPLSGMSMNPARSFASAAPGGLWTGLWIYFTAPVLGMLAGAALFTALRGRARCAKLIHAPDVRCIHCGYEPPRHAGEDHGP